MLFCLRIRKNYATFAQHCYNPNTFTILFMKKFFALILAVVMMLSVAAFAEEADTTATVMTHEEFVAAELASEVTVEPYLQDKQSW